jgi:tetratricopeptide (TPR) repeat protein
VLAALLAAVPAAPRASEPSAPAAATSHYLRARLHEQAGRLGAARNELQLALLHHEGSALLRFAHAELLLRVGEPWRAAAELRRAAELDPAAAASARGRLLVGRVAAAEERWRDAAAALGDAARLELQAARRAGRAPDPDASRLLALVRAEAGDPDGAARALEDLAPALPDAAAAGLVGLADDARDAGELARAERLLRRAGALAPHDPAAWRRLAELETSRGRPAAARAAWEAAARADPDDGETLLALGALAAREGDAAAARAWFAQLLAVRDDAAARAAAALAWLDAGAAREAIPLLEEALAERPAEVALRFWLGVAHESAGDLDAALGHMNALLAIEPDHADALNFVGYSWADRGERLDEAEALLRRALELRPATPAYLDSLGWVYFRKGDVARAVEALERADRLGGPEPTVLEHLGDAYRLAGRASDAATAYQSALSALGVATGPRPSRDLQRGALERKIQELLTSR